MDKLPESLDGTYERILQGIYQGKWKLSRRLFQCVAVASRPLLVKELAEFLAFDFDVEPTPVFRADKRQEDPIYAVLSTCSSLLTPVKRGDFTFIQFSHLSVKEYLTSTRLAGAEELSRYHISLTSAHTLMVQACLSILLHLDEKEITRDGLKNFPIVEYAAKYWVDHARFDGVSANTQDVMKRLFDPRRPHLAIWLWIYDPTISWRIRSERPTQPKESCLHYAAYFGFHDLIMFHLNECSVEVNARGVDDMTALHWASRGGHMGATQVLLERGAYVRIQDKKKSTPLRYALENRHIEVAQLLLDHGAETRAQGMDGWIPLSWASRHGHVEVARLLLKHGAFSGAQDGNKSSALHLASACGYNEVAQLLLEHSADANVEDEGKWTPLYYALKERHVGVARMLLEHGAHTNAQGKYEWIPLHWASQNGYVEIARLLLQYHADPTAEMADKATPLHLASEGGFVELARLLLPQHGVDPSAQNVNKQTPLHVASKNGHAELARALLQLGKGVDVDDRDVNMWTPLHWASRGGHIEVARVLLQFGANAKAEDADKWTPLHLLSDGGFEAARLVLRRGVDTGSQGMVELLQLYQCLQDPENDGIPPEHHEDAIVQDLSKLARLPYKSKGSVELARVLLEKGADAGARDKNNSTPLHLASGCGHVELAQVLLEKGADASAQDKDKSTPLHRVSESGQVVFVLTLLWQHERQRTVPLWYSGRMCRELAELLLFRSADVSAQDKDGFSPLHLASGGAGYLFSSNLLQRHKVPFHSGFVGFENSLEVVELVRVLLTHGADVSVRDKDNSTPLHWTSEAGHVKLARTLLQLGEDALHRHSLLSFKDSKSNWFLGNIERIHMKVARVLLEHGASVDAEDAFGLAPHGRALGARFFDIEQLLLSPYLM